MRIFITGTDTDVGKTLIASWLCIKTGSTYYKPIQTGSELGTDRQFVQKLTKKIMPEENYLYKAPLAPEQAARLEYKQIDIETIRLPKSKKLIVEGAGGLMVPITREILLIDLIKQFNLPLILVARSGLGTINHTLLSLHLIAYYQLNLLGIILNGPLNPENYQSIANFSNVPILMQMPKLASISSKILQQIELSEQLKSIFK